MKTRKNTRKNKLESGYIDWEKRRKEFFAKIDKEEQKAIKRELKNGKYE